MEHNLPEKINTLETKHKLMRDEIDSRSQNGHDGGWIDLHNKSVILRREIDRLIRSCSSGNGC